MGRGVAAAILSPDLFLQDTNLEKTHLVIVFYLFVNVYKHFLALHKKVIISQSISDNPLDLINSWRFLVLFSFASDILNPIE